MLSNMWNVFRKEVYRVLSDKRLVLTVFLVPGLTIYLMYSLLGSVMEGQINEIEQHKTILYQENMPSDLRGVFNAQMNVDILNLNDLESDYETLLLSGDIDVVMKFDADFYQMVTQGSGVPLIEVFYNQGRQNSSISYTRSMNVINTYREQSVIERLENPEDYNVFSLNTEIITDEQSAAGQGVAMILPMLIVIFLFAGAMSIGPDAIAGEKERGTIATLLITPIKRRDIALGKVFSLAVLSLASAVSSFIGVILALPKLMQLEGGAASMDIYGASEYIAILLILMATVLFITGLIAVISAYAKTIKEASMLIMPFYFIAIIVGILNSFNTDVSQEFLVHLIPIYGPINLLAGVFIFDYSISNLVVVVVSSIVYTAALTFVLNMMFKSERLMFQK